MIRIEHIAWQVEDPAAVAAWYGQHFGLTILRKADNPARTHFLADSSGNVIIEIYNNSKAIVPDYHSMDPLLLHIAFAVEDPAAMVAQMLQLGATQAEELVNTPAGDQLVMMRDPWGFALQFVKRKTPLLPL